MLLRSPLEWPTEMIDDHFRVREFLDQRLESRRIPRFEMDLQREPEIAGASARHFEDKVNDIAFRVEFSQEGGDQNMHWVGGQGGPDVVMEEEPYATTGQKLTVGILKWLPIDSQL